MSEMGDKPRVLVAFEPLPKNTGIATLSADVREAMGKVERRLRDRAMTMHATGWQEDEDTEYVVAQRTIIGRLRITRPTA